MTQLNDLIKPTWSAERALNKAWSVLTAEEKETIQNRIDKIFYNEIPFQLEHDKLIYIHLFSLFAQLETIGLRGLIKSLEKLRGTDLYQQMRQQITDEIFHATLFTKLAFQLSAPYALPLGHQKSINHFISSLESEDDLATSLTLVNLVGEGWVEELCIAMKEKNIAVTVFEAVLEDESRHMDEYDLYRQIGLPNKEYLKKKLAIFEDELINTVFAHEQYVTTLGILLGKEGSLKLMNNINQKQHSMLKQIGITPSAHWQLFMDSMPLLLKNLSHDYEKDTAVELTNVRKLLSALWNDPELPTESAIFSINVSPVCFFEKKFKPETITCLMLQALSKACFDNPQARNYIFNHKLYNSHDSHVALAVKIPGSDQLGSIEFKNCHEMTMAELSQHIQHDMSIMTYCYKKTQALQKEHPFLNEVVNRLLTPRHERVYRDFLFARPAISLSNIGHWGYQAAISPLFPSETFKLTLTEIEKKQVWNKATKQFEAQDILPVGLSVDHRVFDGNIPLPHYMQDTFNQMFADMEQAKPKPISRPFSNLDKFIKYSNTLLENDLEFGFLYLFSLMHVWKNYISYDELAKSIEDSYRRIRKNLPQSEGQVG
ncbi:MAG: 2-oxo acid dehydrogenase subunit E2 [Legionella sp.]|uniref:2-oxo acid dehydrogenase subunit E2 n=1 Tax=Legionella sp. TaxID=459 RepID=UPI00283E15FD|nr:2-oxo acid dehydrogenase subunit E2 [Legionella sp.]